MRTVSKTKYRQMQRVVVAAHDEMLRIRSVALAAKTISRYAREQAIGGYIMARHELNYRRFQLSEICPQ